MVCGGLKTALALLVTLSVGVAEAGPRLEVRGTLAVWVNPSATEPAPCGHQEARTMCAPGDDKNDGLDPSRPMLRLQTAFNWIVGETDLRTVQDVVTGERQCSAAKIYVANGEVTAPAGVIPLAANGEPPGLCDGSHLQVLGNPSSPELATIHGRSADAVAVGSPAGGVARFLLRGFRLRTTGPLYSGSGIVIHYGSLLRIGDIDLGDVTFNHIWGHTGGSVVADPAPGAFVRISGNASSFISIIGGANFSLHYIDLRVVGTPCFGFNTDGTCHGQGAFAYVGNNSTLVFDGIPALHSLPIIARPANVAPTGMLNIGTSDCEAYMPGQGSCIIQPGGWVR